MTRRALLRCKTWNLVQLGNVEGDRRGLIGAVFLDELIELLLAAAHHDDLGAFLHDAGRKSLANAGGGSHHENALVWERHDY